MDENFSVNHGFDAYGNHRTAIVEDNQIIHKTTYDAEPFLRKAHEARIANQGKRWGEGIGTKVGELPMAEYAQFLKLPAEERQKFVLNWLRARPLMMHVDKL